MLKRIASGTRTGYGEEWDVTKVHISHTYTGTTEILWRKRDSAATPSRGERPTLALTGFYCFSSPLTSKMVLIYYS